MMGFPGDHSTFRVAFARQIGSQWEALLTVPCQHAQGSWTTLFPNNRSWAIVTNRQIDPAHWACGRCLSPVTTIYWSGKVVRVWRLEPLTVEPRLTRREAYPKALPNPARRRPSYLKLVC